MRTSSGGFVYRADWVDANGRRRRKQLASDKRAAERALAEIVRLRDLELVGLREELGQDLLLEDLKERYLADLSIRRSEGHVVRVRHCIKRVCQGLPHMLTVRDVMPAAINEHIASRARDGAANQTINKEFGAVRALLNWAVAAGLVAQNPIAGVRSLPVGKAYQKLHRRALTDDELRRLLRAAFDDDETSSGVVPQAPLWLALAETAGRWGELTRSCWGDVDERTGLLLRAGTTKSRRERRVPLSARMLSELRRLRPFHHEVYGRLPRSSDPVFLTPTGSPWMKNRPNAHRKLQRLLKLAGIPRANERGETVDIHSLRHTAATRLARAGVALTHAQRILGHSDPKLTAAVYTHLGSEDLREAIARVPDVLDDGLPGTNSALASGADSSAAVHADAHHKQGQ
ncbi:MAG: site-specific integrase [Planctomycetota bacterium]